MEYLGGIIYQVRLQNILYLCAHIFSSIFLSIINFLLSTQILLLHSTTNENQNLKAPLIWTYLLVQSRYVSMFVRT